MELEFQKEYLNGYELILDTDVCQEETQEAIVPDACPDVLRLLDTRAQACLTGKQCRDGAVTVTGLIRACVLYLPEGGGGVCRVETAIPFTAQTEAPGLIAKGAEVCAVPRVRWAETRLMNPRKVLLRADLCIDLQVYGVESREICTGAENGGETVHQLAVQELEQNIKYVRDKPFTITENIELECKQGTNIQLMSVHGTPVCSENRLIGSKLIFKGSLVLDLMVREEEDQLHSVQQSIPFSQVMELEGVQQDCLCQVKLALSELTVRSVSENTQEVTAELLAQAMVCEQEELTVLRDLYSTVYETKTTPVVHRIHQLQDQGSRAVSFRELLDTTTMVRTLCGCRAQLGEVRTEADGAASADIMFTALYLDDGDELQCFRHTCTVQCGGQPIQGGRLHVWCEEPKELFATPASGGLEVRFTLVFHCCLMSQRESAGIASGTLGEELMKSDGTQPSVILRMASPGESLWDIAKSCATTGEEILKANGLESGELPIGKMLLIPRIR